MTETIATETNAAEAANPLPVEPSASGKGRGNSHFILLLVALVCLLPLLAALFFRFMSPPPLGELVGVPLEPALFPFAATVGIDDQALPHPQVSDQWLVLVAGSGECDAMCQNTLYLTRQARTAQGKNMARVQRLWLVSDATVPDDKLLAQHPDLLLVKSIDDKAMAQFLSKPDAIHLIDRRGFVVFRYSANSEPKAFIKELSKLVKF